MTDYKVLEAAPIGYTSRKLFDRPTKPAEVAAQPQSAPMTAKQQLAAMTVADLLNTRVHVTPSATGKLEDATVEILPQAQQAPRPAKVTPEMEARAAAWSEAWATKIYGTEEQWKKHCEEQEYLRTLGLTQTGRHALAIKAAREYAARRNRRAVVQPTRR